MIETGTLVTYVLILLGFMFIPGPAVLMTVARASTSGTRVGIATGLGIAAGDLIHTLLAVVGISAIVLASAWAFTLVKYLGAAYLIYLGVKAILERAKTNVDQDTVRLSEGAAFRQAILAEVLNPKSAMFFLAFLPQFVDPGAGSVALQLSVLGVLFVVIGLFSTLIFAVCAGGFGTFLRRHPTVLKWQGKVVGSIYCALGVRLAFQER